MPRSLWQRAFIAYGYRVARLPTICPQFGPTVAAVITIPVFVQLSIAPWLLIVGVIVFALWPQWDSCLFGLQDFLAACAIIGFGVVAAARLIAA